MKWETEKEEKFSWLHQMHDVNFFLSFPLLSIMLIDETTCVSHTLTTNWNKIASFHCSIFFFPFFFFCVAFPWAFQSICFVIHWKSEWGQKLSTVLIMPEKVNFRGTFKTDLKLFGLEKHRKSIKKHDGAWKNEGGEWEWMSEWNWKRTF